MRNDVVEPKRHNGLSVGDRIVFQSPAGSVSGFLRWLDETDPDVGRMSTEDGRRVIEVSCALCRSAEGGELGNGGSAGSQERSRRAGRQPAASAGPFLPLLNVVAARHLEDPLVMGLAAALSGKGLRDIDEVSGLVSQAADAAAARAEALRNGARAQWQRTCLMMGDLRSLNAAVWRLPGVV